MRRAFATITTLGILSGFLFVVVLGLLVALGRFNFTVAIGLVIAINLIVLLVGPRVNDIIYQWLYGLEWISMDELRTKSPAGAEVIEDVTRKYEYKQPKLGYINDRNPNAFTYGTGRFNARIVLTEGCFEFLDDEEVASVIGHELGHITSRDFIIMTIANTIVQLLYLIAIYSRRIAANSRGRGGRNRAGGALLGVAVLSYVFWFVGEYAVMYLSRVREYAADRFAAEHTHPDNLSSALVKIAYGIVMSEDSKELSQATRNIGIMNLESSKDEGLIYHNTRDEEGDSDLLLQSFLFDLKNPWAKVAELKSTHPLTGKRVKALSELPSARRFNFDVIERKFDVDRGRLWRAFFRDIGVLLLPSILAVGFPIAYLAGAVSGAISFSLYAIAGGWLSFIGGAILVRTMYKFPRKEGADTTVLELLADVYASPVRGTAAKLDGELIGRGQPGYAFSEDMMFKDETGLMYLRYEHWLPVIGNFLFSVGRVPELVGQEVTVDGWFLRGTRPWMGLRDMSTDSESIRGYIDLGGYVLGGLLVGLGVIVLIAGA